MKKLLLGLAIFSLVFGFVFIKSTLGEENKPDVFFRNKMKELIREFDDLFKEMNKSMRLWKGHNYFVLTPSGQVMAGGKIEKLDFIVPLCGSESLTSTSVVPTCGTGVAPSFVLNTNGFKTTWQITTSTKLVGKNKEARNFDDLKVEDYVRVKGRFDGQNLIAEHLIVFPQPKFQPAQPTSQDEKIQNLLLRLQKLLQERGYNFSFSTSTGTSSESSTSSQTSTPASQ